MFHRIQLEPWLHYCPKIAMAIFLTVFLFALVRILLAPKNRLQHLESLPLDSNEIPRHEH